MAFLFDLGEIPSVPVAGSADRFPVRRIFCVGRNYEDHAREMGFQPDREEPFFFTKPADALVHDGATIEFPRQSGNVHHEIELVVAIGREGRDIPVEQALDYVWGYAVGDDLTRRDLQIKSREKGRPWDAGKAFDDSAHIGTLYPASQVGHPTKGRIWLKVNGETRQDADISLLIWSIPELIAYFSKLYVLKPGDLIYTGTPAGVGPVKPGDVIEGGIDGLGTLTVRLAS